MRLHWIVGTVVLASGVFLGDSLAERPPEDRPQATHVVVGNVQGVYLRREGRALDYIIEIAIEKAEKGDGLKAGEMFYVGCYLWDGEWLKGQKLSEKQQKQLALQGPAYDGIPKEGDRVKVYAKHRGGRY